MTKKKFIEDYNSRPFDPFHPPIAGKCTSKQFLYVIITWGCLYCSYKASLTTRFDPKMVYCQHCGVPECLYHLKDIHPDTWHDVPYDKIYQRINPRQLTNGHTCRACKNPEIDHDSVKIILLFFISWHYILKNNNIYSKHLMLIMVIFYVLQSIHEQFYLLMEHLEIFYHLEGMIN